MKLRSIIITGASGFIGRYLVENFKEEFIIYAIARRTRLEANVPYHQNVKWIQCDIASIDVIHEVGKYISENGGADFIFHLAAFYDFSYNDNPEYYRSNVLGTENVLELGKQIGIKRFIFASSLAACDFPENGEIVTEKTPANADYAYARSKRIGEGMLKKYTGYFPCLSVRFAAVFSDWCEYAPLYKFLATWLSGKIDSRIIAGNGESAIPYIHINDLIALFRKIVQKNDNLPEFDILNASPNGSSSHLELFKIATRYYFGEQVEPTFLPKLLAYPGLFAKNLLKYVHLTCEEPFEKTWMIKYIDKKLNVDSTYTQNLLDWSPTQRLRISRRLLFLLEKLKSHPDEWALKNEAALKRVARRANILIYEALTNSKETVLPVIIRIIRDPNEAKFRRYQLFNDDDFHCYLSTLYHLLMATVRSNDRKLMLSYIDEIAIKRFAEGFLPEEICSTLQVYKEVIIEQLNEIEELKKFKQEVYDNIGLTLQLAQDEIEDLYDNLLKKITIDKIADSPLMPDCADLQRMIRQLSAFYQIAPESTNYRQLNLSNVEAEKN